MQTNAYCVYDNKALVYGTPFFAPTDGAAVRLFQELANDLSTTVGRHPNDFSLFIVGSFDDQHAVLIGVSPVRHVVDAAAVLVKPTEQLPFDRLATTDTVARSNGEAR